jgi:AhpD family alkylhydroperoxidase
MSWGEEATIRARLRHGFDDVRLSRRIALMSYQFGPAETVDFFRQYYGPTQRAFASLDATGQAALRQGFGGPANRQQHLEDSAHHRRRGRVYGSRRNPELIETLNISLPIIMYNKDNLKKVQDMNNLAPKVMKAFWEFDKLAVADGAIPVKYKELIAVAVALTTQCPYCIDIHAGNARKAGANDSRIGRGGDGRSLASRRRGGDSRDARPARLSSSTFTHQIRTQ